VLTLVLYFVSLLSSSSEDTTTNTNINSSMNISEFYSSSNSTSSSSAFSASAASASSSLTCPAHLSVLQRSLICLLSDESFSSSSSSTSFSSAYSYWISLFSLQSFPFFLSIAHTGQAILILLSIQQLLLYTFPFIRQVTSHTHTTTNYQSSSDQARVDSVHLLFFPCLLVNSP